MTRIHITLAFLSTLAGCAIVKQKVLRESPPPRQELDDQRVREFVIGAREEWARAQSRLVDARANAAKTEDAAATLDAVSGLTEGKRRLDEVLRMTGTVLEQAPSRSGEPVVDGFTVSSLNAEATKQKAAVAAELDGLQPALATAEARFQKLKLDSLKGDRKKVAAKRGLPGYWEGSTFASARKRLETLSTTPYFGYTLINGDLTCEVKVRFDGDKLGKEEKECR